MTIYWLIFVCLIIIQCCEALQCNKCKTSKCEEVEPETCAVATGVSKAACLVHVYISDAGNTVTDKKCVNLDNEGKYKCDQSLGKEEKCTVCTENMCNRGQNLGVGTSVLGLSVLLWVFTRIFD